MSIEDLALTCSLPGFTVMAPSDEFQTAALVKAAAAHVGPVFIRTGRAKAAKIYGPDTKFEIGKSIQLIDGKDVTLIAHGLMVAASIRAAETLQEEGISVRVIDMHTIKPLDVDAISSAASETGAIVVSEEHLMNSGLGAQVAQVVTQTQPCVMEFVGVENTYAESGSPDGILKQYGLTPEKVAEAARRALSRKR